MKKILNTDLLNKASVLSEVNESGFVIIEQAVSLEFCQQAIDFIKSYDVALNSKAKRLECQLDKGIEHHYNRTELRIYGAEKRSELLASYSKEVNSYMGSLFPNLEFNSLLAIQNKALHKQNLEFKQERWHLDSFRKQYKFFVYLADVGNDNGATELIPKTHHFWFKVCNIQNYFSLHDILMGRRENKRKYQSLSEPYIKKLLNDKFSSQKVLCKAGSAMVVDTSCIHRASPCLSGFRSALTSYYY